MPPQQPAGPFQPPLPHTPAGAAASDQPAVADYERSQEEWMADSEELPRRPRRRLLTPLPLALLGVLLIACGFIGGVLVEKGETSSGSSTASGSGLASRFAALRGGTTSTAGGSGLGSPPRSSGGTGGFTRPTSGTVAYLAGSTLYVTNSEGNTIRVKTSAGTTVTKSVTAHVAGIHPGETVSVTGAAGSNGAVTAETISVGGVGAGGLAALFGGTGSGSSSSTGTSSSSSTGTGAAPSLFGG
jgi:hypothetical protein